MVLYYAMQSLDIRTLVAGYTVSVFVCVLASAMLWKQNRHRFPATGYWLLSFSLQFLTLILVLLRGITPDLLSIIGNSLTAMAACIALRRGLEQFFGQTSSRQKDVALVSAFLLLQLYFTYVVPSLYVRNIVYAFFLMVLFIQCTLVSLRVTLTGMVVSARINAAVMGSHALLNAVRIVGAYFVETGDRFFLPNAVDSMVFLVYDALVVALTFSLTLLINQRLRLDMQSDLQRISQSEAALRDSEAKLKRAEVMGETGHWALNLTTQKIIGSEQAARIYGLETTQLDVEAIRDMRLEEYRAPVDQALTDLLTLGKPYDVEFKIRARSSGLIREVRSLATYDSATSTVFGILRDVTEQKNIERKLRDREGIFRMAIETSPSGFWIVDHGGQLLDVNTAYERLSGYSREELLTKHIADLEAVEDPVQTRRHMKDIVAKGHGNFESVHRRKDGTQWNVEVVCSYAAAEGGRFFVFVRDITERRNIAELNWHHANFDHLTDLPNRALLFDRLSTACALARRNKKRVAFLFMDLDGFKSVNDRLGHEAGDEVLIEVAQRWMGCVRSADTVARLGGDEFAIVAGGIERTEDVARLATKLVEETKRTITLSSGAECQVGASIGVSVYPTDAVEMDTLVNLADAAMYESKRGGKNRFTFSHSIDKPTSEDPNWVPFTADQELGVGIMDEQHRNLVGLLNQINLAINKTESTSATNTMFAELVDYTLMHFATELELMRRYAYPNLRQHDHEHARLIQEVKALTARFEEGAQMATLQVLKDWLTGHIHGSDRRLAEYLRSRGCS